jgi:nicotinate-nucleotide adenylyltransferase
MKIALLGGSFNPPHLGHLDAAVFVHEKLGDDEVWLMPSFHHPFGKAMVDFAHRVRMCELLAQRAGPWLKVSQVERDVGGDGRTIDTLKYLLPRHPGAGFRLVLGSDIVSDLPKWKSWDEIQRLVEVTVLNRAGFPYEKAVGPPLSDVSSTEVRAAVANGERPKLMPAEVLEYIQTHELYRS